jgi:hypothetical protein
MVLKRLVGQRQFKSHAGRERASRQSLLLLRMTTKIARPVMVITLESQFQSQKHVVSASRRRRQRLQAHESCESGLGFILCFVHVLALYVSIS